MVARRQDDSFTMRLQRLNERSDQVNLIQIAQNHIDEVLNHNIAKENANTMKLLDVIKENGARLLSRI
jgi:hypothetical protein